MSSPAASNIKRSGFLGYLRGYVIKEDGVAATEAALVFPILLTLLVGVFDMGFGILAAQKTIRASQVTADLIARHRSVDALELNEAIEAGILSLVPFDTASYGVDIVSLEFDENNIPQILWRETRNMTANDGPMSDLVGLGADGEGIVFVTVRYTYTPAFSGFVVGEIGFNEVSFVRGRLSSTVPWQNGG